MNARKVKTGDERDEGEDDKAEVWIGREEGIVQPITKGILAGAGVMRGCERRRYGGVCSERREERACGGIGIGER